MDVILSSVKWRFRPVYLEDIVVFSKVLEKYIYHDLKVLSLFSSAAATLKLKKGSFVLDVTDNLGHLIRPKRLKLSSRTIGTIRWLKPTTDDTHLNHFLGICIEIQQFVPSLARLAAAVAQRLKKDRLTSFLPLDSKVLYAMENAKAALNKLPLLGVGVRFL